MSYLEELLPEFRKGAKIRRKKWVEEDYIQLSKDGVFDDFGNIISKDDFIYRDWFLKDDWELCKDQEPIDWEYIIKNKCLCCFWDEYESCKVKGTLAEIENDNEYPFRIDLYNSHYRHCRPVRRGEVTFYEERKDGNI